MLIPREYRYPIYYVGSAFTWDGMNSKIDHDSTGGDIMFKTDPGIHGALEHAQFMWENYFVHQKPRFTKEDKGSYLERNVQLIRHFVEFRGYETWCLLWFQHYTLNIHLSDEELLLSFEMFVRKKEPLQRNLDVPLKYRDPTIGTYCLMGAEDRWRWKGPCRCEYCRAQGVVRIDH